MKYTDTYAHAILDAVPLPIAVSDGKQLFDANPALLKLLGYPTLEAFKKEHACICDFFEKGDTDDYLLTKMGELTWAEYAQKHPEREHKVKITLGGEERIFSIKVSSVQLGSEYREIAVLSDITSSQQQSTTDALTGLANRLHFNLLFSHAIKSAAREKSPLGLVFFDIDLFKNVNDTHGHLVGDDVLRTIADRVKSTLRQSDLLARWGGEEFIILLPNTPLDSATEIAEKIRQMIENHPFETAGRITCSFGVTQFDPNEDALSALGRIDELLYDAKASGRNRVVAG